MEGRGGGKTEHQGGGVLGAARGPSIPALMTQAEPQAEVNTLWTSPSAPSTETLPFLWLGSSLLPALPLRLTIMPPVDFAPTPSCAP